MDHLLLDLALKGTVVLLSAALVARVLRNRSATARHLVWSVALASLIALPLLSVTLPGWRLAILPAAPAAAAGSATAPAPDGSPWDRIAVLAWLAGAVVVTVGTAVGSLRVWWLARSSDPLDDPDWSALACGVRGQLGLARKVRLRIVERSVMPMVWGVRRPVVLLPASAWGWSVSLRRHVLLHELAHVQRHDYLVQVVSRLALAIHWFNPLAWAAARCLRVERERACDDHVLGHGASPCDYAQHLVEMARRLRPSRRSVLALGMADSSRFGERVAALLDERRCRRVLTGRLAVGGALLAAGVVVPLAAIRPAARPSPPAPVAMAPAEAATPPGPSPAANVQGTADRAEPARTAAEPAVRRPPPAPRSEAAARAAQIVHVDPIEVIVEWEGSSSGVLEANTTRGVPRPPIARVEYRSSAGPGEWPDGWMSSSEKVSETCEGEEREAPARPAQLVSTTPETGTP
ncbi:MAG: M56 family metallopeptidase [Gemmatimonadetes bacterium]|nr:M56 family metallopeptidase [Gemmatimonadota bacterium]